MRLSVLSKRSISKKPRINCSTLKNHRSSSLEPLARKVKMSLLIPLKIKSKSSFQSKDPKSQSSQAQMANSINIFSKESRICVQMKELCNFFHSSTRCFITLPTNRATRSKATQLQTLATKSESSLGFKSVTPWEN